MLEARGCNPSARLRAQGLPQAGAAALPGVRGLGSSERSRPGGRSSGARGDGSGHGESRAEAETQAPQGPVGWPVRTALPWLANQEPCRPTWMT